MFMLWTPSYIVALCLLCSCYEHPVILLLSVCYVHVMNTRLYCCSVFVMFMLWTPSYIVALCFFMFMLWTPSYIVALCFLCLCYEHPVILLLHVCYVHVMNTQLYCGSLFVLFMLWTPTSLVITFNVHNCNSVYSCPVFECNKISEVLFILWSRI